MNEKLTHSSFSECVSFSYSGGRDFILFYLLLTRQSPLQALYYLFPLYFPFKGTDNRSLLPFSAIPLRKGNRHSIYHLISLPFLIKEKKISLTLPRNNVIFSTKSNHLLSVYQSRTWDILKIRMNERRIPCKKILIPTS